MTLDDERQLEVRNLSSAAWLGHSVAAPSWSRRDALPFGVLGGANERLSPQSTEALGSRNADGTAVVVRLTSKLGTRQGRPKFARSWQHVLVESWGWYMLVGNQRSEARGDHFPEPAQC
jgi:hypothetical protein